MDDLIDFTPELRQKALDIVKNYKLGPIFTPPVLSKRPGPLATLGLGPANGGTNWPGGSFNPENHTAYLYACNACIQDMGLVAPPPGFTDLPYVEGIIGHKVEMVYASGANAGADSAPALKVKAPPPPASDADDFGLEVNGLPLIKPPYATISAINLDQGDIVWQVPAGESPNFIRTNPALKGLNIPRTGQVSYNIGTLVTRSLVIAGDGQVTTTPDHPRGAMLRAYDQATGKDVGDVLMPAGQSGSPMTYMVNGKQYIVVAVSGGNYSGEYICYTLPDNE